MYLNLHKNIRIKDPASTVFGRALLIWFTSLSIFCKYHE